VGLSCIERLEKSGFQDVWHAPWQRTRVLCNGLGVWSLGVCVWQNS
jgi:hypothetical protein